MNLKAAFLVGVLQIMVAGVAVADCGDIFGNNLNDCLANCPGECDNIGGTAVLVSGAALDLHPNRLTKPKQLFKCVSCVTFWLLIQLTKAQVLLGTMPFERHIRPPFQCTIPWLSWLEINSLHDMFNSGMMRKNMTIPLSSGRITPE